MKFGLLDGRDGEHNGVGLVERSNIFEMHGDFCLWNRSI